MSASSAFHDTFGRDAFGNYGRPDAGAPGGGSAPAVQDSPGSRQLAAVRGPRARQAPLKLTRRGRLVFIGVPLMLLAALILTLSGFLNAPAKAAESTGELSPTPTVTVTVQPGESLWAIAAAVVPGRDPRDVVADIIELNNLGAARVVPGQALFIPST
ncbi:LysM peptidoglycan-binding domain-containing protein [Pseudarthrobacter sp. PH31-O2]|uniref:LysM peptidoglycan-binding domain-containing protein n=1 Tax=Pseudarthrobacter sp. PH31-O2 TaxID=3046206 RepID=UPI0032D929F5